MKKSMLVAGCILASAGFAVAQDKVEQDEMVLSNGEWMLASEVVAPVQAKKSPYMNGYFVGENGNDLVIEMPKPDEIIPPAAQICIDFDNLGAPCTFNLTTALRNEYAGVGVEFDGPAARDGGGALDQCGNFGVNARSGTAFLAFNGGSSFSDGGIPRDPETIRFPGGASMVSMWLSGGSNTNGIRLQAFDSGGNLVDSTTVNAPGGAYAEAVLSGAGIVTVTVDDTGDGIFVMDDLCYDEDVQQGDCIDFDDLGAPCTFNLTTALRNEYAGQGVTFDGPASLDGGGAIDQCGNFGVNARSGTAFLAFNAGCGSCYSDGGTPRGPQTIRWNSAVSSVSMWVSGGSNTNTIRVEAFNSGGGLVDSTSVNAPGGGYAEAVVSGAGIVRVVMTDGGDGVWVMDDLCWEAGPGQCLNLSNTGYIGGQPVTWTVSGGTPGFKAVVVYGFNAGNLNLNNYSASGRLWCATIDIAGVNPSKIVGNPKVLDAAGEASWTKTMPLNQVGNTILTQAVGSDTCPDDCQSDVDSTTVQ